MLAQLNPSHTALLLKMPSPKFQYLYEASLSSFKGMVGNAKNFASGDQMFHACEQLGKRLGLRACVCVLTVAG